MLPGCPKPGPPSLGGVLASPPLFFLICSFSSLFLVFSFLSHLWGGSLRPLRLFFLVSFSLSLLFLFFLIFWEFSSCYGLVYNTTASTSKQISAAVEGPGGVDRCHPTVRKGLCNGDAACFWIFLGASNGSGQFEPGNMRSP